MNIIDNERKQMQILVAKFKQHFITTKLTLELMEIVPQDQLKEIIIRQFNENFMYAEIYRIFKDSLNLEELKELLEIMGHDFVELKTDNDWKYS